jgi:hypothetical protein
MCSAVPGGNMIPIGRKSNFLQFFICYQQHHVATALVLKMNGYSKKMIKYGYLGIYKLPELDSDPDLGVKIPDPYPGKRSGADRIWISNIVQEEL